MADKYAHLAPGRGSRACRRSDGAPKRQFADEVAAEVVVSRAAAEGKLLRAYACPFGDHWYVATDRNPT